MMISNDRINSVSFKQLPQNIVKVDKAIIGKEIEQCIKDGKTSLLSDITKGQAPAYLRFASKMMNKLVPFSEEKFMNKGKLEMEDLVNAGNVAKELVCMIVYPLQVLTNPDLPKEKRRFVGLYDFFVTCFSLAGTLIYAFKGKKITAQAVDKIMEKTGHFNNPKFPKAIRAAKGAAFVVGLAIQTILFKRILAPALSPPLAAKSRKYLEDRDRKKAEMNAGSSLDAEKASIKPEAAKGISLKS